MLRLLYPPRNRASNLLRHVDTNFLTLDFFRSECGWAIRPPFREALDLVSFRIQLLGEFVCFSFSLNTVDDRVDSLAKIVRNSRVCLRYAGQEALVGGCDSSRDVRRHFPLRLSVLSEPNSNDCGRYEEHETGDNAIRAMTLLVVSSSLFTPPDDPSSNLLDGLRDFAYCQK